MPSGFLSFSSYLVVSFDVFLCLFDACLSNYDIHLITFVPRGVSLFPHLSPPLTFNVILPTLTQSAHISEVSVFLSLSPNLFSVWPSLSLPCCLSTVCLLFSLHSYVQCPFLSLSCSFPLSQAIQCLLSVSLRCHTQIHLVLPLYFSPHQSNVPIFPFIFLSCI